LLCHYHQWMTRSYAAPSTGSCCRKRICPGLTPSGAARKANLHWLSPSPLSLSQRVIRHPASASSSYPCNARVSISVSATVQATFTASSLSYTGQARGCPVREKQRGRTSRIRPLNHRLNCTVSRMARAGRPYRWTPRSRSSTTVSLVPRRNGPTNCPVSAASSASRSNTGMRNAATHSVRIRVPGGGEVPSVANRVAERKTAPESPTTGIRYDLIRTDGPATWA
jgi:hypothetical protein